MDVPILFLDHRLTGLVTTLSFWWKIHIRFPVTFMLQTLWIKDMKVSFSTQQSRNLMYFLHVSCLTFISMRSGEWSEPTEVMSVMVVAGKTVSQLSFIKPLFSLFQTIKQGPLPLDNVYLIPNSQDLLAHSRQSCYENLDSYLFVMEFLQSSP